MKYELIKTDFGRETIADADGNYSINITIALHPTDLIAPAFSNDISVVSNNSQTGIEVDKARQTAIEDYLIIINK